RPAPGPAMLVVLVVSLRVNCPCVRVMVPVTLNSMVSDSLLELAWLTQYRRSPNRPEPAPASPRSLTVKVAGVQRSSNASRPGRRRDGRLGCAANQWDNQDGRRAGRRACDMAQPPDYGLTSTLTQAAGLTRGAARPPPGRQGTPTRADQPTRLHARGHG